jgi:hypothetical protein
MRKQISIPPLKGRGPRLLKKYCSSMCRRINIMQHWEYTKEKRSSSIAGFSIGVSTV